MSIIRPTRAGMTGRSAEASPRNQVGGTSHACGSFISHAVSDGKGGRRLALAAASAGAGGVWDTRGVAVGDEKRCRVSFLANQGSPELWPKFTADFLRQVNGQAAALSATAAVWWRRLQLLRLARWPGGWARPR